MSLLFGFVSGASTAAAPVETATIEDVGALGGSVTAVAVSGTLAFAGQGGTFAAFDVSNPSEVLRLSYLFMPDFVGDIKLVGPLAYAATRTDGLQIIDIHDPYHLQLLGVYSTTGTIYAVDVEGSFAYLAVTTPFSSSLQVVDINDPQQPLYMGEYSLSPNVFGILGIDVVYPYAYTIGYDGLRILDVTDPATPTLRGYLNLRFDPDFTNERAVDIEIVGQMAVVVGGGMGPRRPSLVTVDVSLPTTPTLMDLLESGLSDIYEEVYLSLGVAGNLAYVGTNYGFKIIDLATPTALAELSHYPPNVDNLVINDLYVESQRAYLAAGDEGLQIVDVSSSPSPTKLGESNVFGVLLDVQAGFPFLYTTDYEQILQVVDISNPSEPTLLASGLFPGYGHDLEVVSHTAYINRFNDDFEIYDVTDPVSPTLLGRASRAGHGSFTAMTVNGDYAYLGELLGGTQQTGINVLDISDPAQPEYLSQIDHISGSGPQAMKAQGNFLYVSAGDGGLVILDVTNPLHPEIIGRNASFWGSAIDVAGDLAYLGGVNGGLYVFDVSNPAAPTLLSQYAISSVYPGEIQVAGDRAYIADGRYGLWVFDISNPYSPSLYASHKVQRARGMAISDGYIALACGSGGLRIVRIVEPEPPVRFFLPVVLR